MFERVQRDAPQHPGGVVAKMPRRIPVGSFVDGDRKKHGQGINSNVLNQVGNVHGEGVLLGEGGV